MTVPATPIDLASWRSRLVERTLLVAVFLMPVVMLLGLPVYRASGRWGLLVLDASVWAAAAVILALPRVSYVARATTILAIWYVLTVTFFATLGPGHARSGWLVGGAILATLYFGHVAGVLMTSLHAVTLLVLYLALGEPGRAWLGEHADFGTWLLYVASISGLTLAVVLPVGILVRGLDVALRRERSLRDRLDAEREELSAAQVAREGELGRRLELEVNLRRAQKLEALGRLAGGIAHDLNNILVPILTYAELTLGHLSDDSKERRHLEQVVIAVHRARDLVAQVLSFSRDVGPAHDAVRLELLLRELAAQLKPGLGEGLEVVVEIEGTPAPVRAARTALYQVFLNLATNALAAMTAAGGRLTFHVRGLAPGQAGLEDRHTTPARPRAATLVEVRDTGCGMDEVTAARVFEPFFTTRPFGEGVGLGLATAQSIVDAFEGRITLETAPGRGSIFRVVLPAVDELEEAARAESAPLAAAVGALPARPVGGRRALLVEDNADTRMAIRLQLLKLGLNVEAVADARAALACLEAEEDGIDLLLTGARMPEVSGLELAAQARALRPSLPILLTSGFADAAIQTQAARLGIRHILPKPFSLAELQRALAGVERG